MFKQQGLKETPSITEILTLLDKTAGEKSSSERETSGDNPKDFTPPVSVRKEALRGIELSYKNDYPSYNGIGLARAIQLVTQEKIWKKSVERMNAFFKRNKRFESLGDENSKSYMAYLNWGGKSGQEWASSVL